MLQPVVRKRRRRYVGFMRVRRCYRNLLATQLHRDALLPSVERSRRIDAARDLGAEHRLEEPGSRVRVWAPQMDVIVLIVTYCCLLSVGDAVSANRRVVKQCGGLGPSRSTREQESITGRDRTTPAHLCSEW